jgi:hypothetical protein
MVELLRATPLPVKFHPDAAIRVYKSTARFELWPISYVRIKNQGNEDQNLEQLNLWR